MSIQALLNVNQIAARKGAAELEFAVKKVHSLDASKGSPDGYLQAINRRVEGIVLDEIKRFYPEDNFLGAETGSEVNNSNITWVLKAIDGEANFMNGYPHFALSLTCLMDEEPVTAVVIFVVTVPPAAPAPPLPAPAPLPPSAPAPPVAVKSPVNTPTLKSVIAMAPPAPARWPRRPAGMPVPTAGAAPSW